MTDNPASAERGTMIELRIDRERIRTLAPVRRQTELDQAAVVAPADGPMRQAAEPVADRLGAPVLDASGFAGVDRLDRDLIAVGHAACNALLRRMQDLQLLSNADYPRDGLRVVSMHNPLGDGHNVVAALGFTVEAARRSIERLLECAVERDGRRRVERRLQEVEPRPETPDPGAFVAEAMQSKAQTNTRPEHFLRALEHLNATGDQAWARAFVDLVTPYATGAIPLSFWLMSAVDFWTDRLVIGWDRAEPFDFFTDGERLLVANFIASCTEYCHDSITYQKWRITEDVHQVFNHHTFPARGLYFGCMHLRRRGYEVVDIDGWLEKSLAVFRRAAEAGRSFDEGGAGYSWLVANHLLEVDQARADLSYARSEKLARYADLAIAIQNNHAELVPFGDCGAYHGKAAGAANVLLRAAEFHADAGFKWAAVRCAPDVFDVATDAMPAEPPDRHVGLFVLPMDPTIHAWTDRPRFPNYPDPLRKTNVPPEAGFDKMSLRAGWAPDDDYLLVQGFGEGQHGHPDANAISQYQARSRLFLVDNDYIRRMPRQHNMVMVVRDGAFEPVPVTARLDATAAFDGGAVTQSTLVDYNGCDWTRTLVWLANDCIVAVDSLAARLDGEYDLRCYWRTLGEASPTERGLHAEHDGEHFHVIELTDSERRLDVEPPPLNSTDYPKYEYGDGRPKILSERRRVRLRAGDEVCFVNLLLPNGHAPNGREPKPRRRIHWAGRGHVLVAGDGPAIAINSDGVKIEGVTNHTFEPHHRLTALDAPDARPTPPPGLATAAAAKESWRAALPAPASCLSPIDDAGWLVGCEDGAVVKVARDGAARRLARADERIGAVLAGRLWGESELTLLAAGHDAKLRLLHADGSERLSTPLPFGSHMPAWGRALTLADLDGDGKLWPIVGTASWRVHAVAPDGGLRWTFATAAHSVTSLAAGDLNGDGRDEIAVGTVYFCVPAVTADGERLWQDEDYNDYWRAGPLFDVVHVADVDADGRLEVVTAASDTLVHCISHTGEKRWTASVGDDPVGLVVTPRGVAAASRTGDVHLFDGHGRRLWRRTLDAPCTALTAAGEALCAATESGCVYWLDHTGETVCRLRLDSPVTHLLDAAAGSEANRGIAFAATVDGHVALIGQ